jgi:hypothetical protein
MDKLFNIQLFAEEDGMQGEPAGSTEKQTNEPGTDPKAQPKYTDEDVDKLINKKFAEWQKQQEKNKAKDAEAARLAQMTAEEKANERIRQLEERLAAADREKAVTAMTKQARAMLQDKGIVVGDELLANLIAEDAEGTKAAVENFITLFNAAKDQAVKDALKGAAPKAGSAPTGMTKEQILAVSNRAERQRLMKENAHLF